VRVLPGFVTTSTAVHVGRFLRDRQLSCLEGFPRALVLQRWILLGQRDGLNGAVSRRGCVRREGARRGFAQEGWSSRSSQIRNENRNALPTGAQVGAPTSARSPTINPTPTAVVRKTPALLIGGYVWGCLTDG
jgi:hypothetical protein